MIRYAFAKREPLRVEQENFRDAIHGNLSAVVSMSDGVETLRVVEAMLDAARDGTTVRL